MQYVSERLDEAGSTHQTRIAGWNTFYAVPTRWYITGALGCIHAHTCMLVIEYDMQSSYRDFPVWPHTPHIKERGGTAAT
jgi:hypothetical protein